MSQHLNNIASAELVDSLNMVGGGGEIGSKYGNVSGFIFIFNLVVSHANLPAACSSACAQPPKAQFNVNARD